jgi:hypothetical protein
MKDIENNEIIAIETKKYWEIINDICNSLPENEWFLQSRNNLDKKLLGLKSATVKSPLDFNKQNKKNFGYTPINWVDFQTHKFFTICDKEKYLWTKLKYGI